MLRHKLEGKLPRDPTVEEALYAVARVGGHIKSNGPPGWQVLGRGYDQGLLMEQGWLAAMATMVEGRSDQS